MQVKSNTKINDELNFELNKIKQLIQGLRKVIRLKSNSLSILVSTTNGFYNQNFRITKEIEKYDLKQEIKPNKKQLKVFYDKFKKSKKHLDEIIKFLELKTNSKTDFSKPKLNSFNEFLESIDTNLSEYQINIELMIKKIKPNQIKEINLILKKEIKKLTDKEN